MIDVGVMNAITQPRTDEALLNALRGPARPRQGRHAECRFRDICGGGFRVRAWQRHGDPGAVNPGCHLSEEEILAPAAAA